MSGLDTFDKRVYTTHGANSSTLQGVSMNERLRPGPCFRFPVRDSDFRSGWCGNRPQCVAVAVTAEGVAIRDTKDEGKTTLFFDHDEFSAFKQAVLDGRI